MWILLVAALLALPSAAAEERRAGTVTNPSGKRVWVRSEPPRVTAFGYILGEPICAVGVGTEFEVSAAFETQNGELWYAVTVGNPIDAINNFGGNCSTVPLSGWLIGRLKTGWTVTFRPAKEVKLPAPVKETEDEPPTAASNRDATEGQSTHHTARGSL
jgi:hypothetical protein